MFCNFQYNTSGHLFMTDSVFHLNPYIKSILKLKVLTQPSNTEKNLGNLGSLKFDNFRVKFVNFLNEKIDWMFVTIATVR